MLEKQKKYIKNEKESLTEKFNKKVKDNFYIFGKNAVIEAITNENEIQKVFVCFGSDNLKIITLAKKHKINCTTLDKNRFKELEFKVFSENKKQENLVKNQVKSQGVIALKQIIETFDLSEFISKLDLKQNPIIAILDGINDPQNLGAIDRKSVV